MLSKFLISLFVLGCWADDGDDEAVHTLTQENFDSFIAEHPRALVEFYAPWCGHCKALAPEFEAAAQVLHADEGLGTVLAKVDATEDKDLASKYGVRGFPTLKYFTGGDSESPDDYTGGRTKDTIIQWLTVRALPAVSQLTSADEVEKFKASAKVTIIGFFGEDSDGAKTLLSVADANREAVVIGQVTDDALTTELGGKSGTIGLYAEWNEACLVYDGEMTEEGIMGFVNGERFPLIDAIGPENYKDYMDRGLPLVWISIDGSDDEMVKTVTDGLTPHAANFKGELSFTWVDSVKYAQHVENLGITSTPGLLIAGEPNKFLFQGELSDDDAVSTFFNSYKDGSLQPFLKSQEIPEANDESVMVVVGKSFSTVIGGEQDVFMEFYAPWCGHCKRLAPEYEKVGDAFADVDGVVIAKLDATENDTPEQIQGFPTLIFYEKGSTTGIKYEGKREADAIVEWITEHATVDVSNKKEL